MNILVDVNIPKLTVEFLRTNGHIVSDQRGTRKQGSTDDEVWQKVLNEKALLITTDKGFTTRRDEQHYGILIIRLRQSNLAKIHARIMLAIVLRGDIEGWRNLTLVLRDTVQSAFRNRTI